MLSADSTFGPSERFSGQLPAPSKLAGWSLFLVKECADEDFCKNCILCID